MPCRTRRVLLAGAALLLLAGCATAGQGWKADTGTEWLKEIDDGNTVHVEVGETVAVSLRQTPGECYEWEIDSFDEDVLKLDRTEVLSDLPGRSCAGADMNFYFKAAASGSADIRLVYARGWIDGEKLFEVRVIVR